MAWIELHDTLPDHPKVIDLADALKLDKDAVVGKLVRLWVWALNSREDGFLRAKDATTVVDVMRLKSKPLTLMRIMVDVGFLDESDGGYYIHDWDDHVARLMESRERRRSQARERQARKRARDKACHANVTHDERDENAACNAATVPKPYLDDDDDTTTSMDSARAQGVIHRISTEEVEKAYRDYVGRAPTPAELEHMLSRSDSPELIVEAIKRAALNGCRSVRAYVDKLLLHWFRARLETVEQLEAWEEQWDNLSEPFDEMEGT